MIIEEEQKVEIVEDSTKTEKQEFKQIPNNSEKTSKHWIMAICIFLISFLCIYNNYIWSIHIL